MRVATLLWLLTKSVCLSGRRRRGWALGGEPAAVPGSRRCARANQLATVLRFERVGGSGALFLP